ncbi:MAG: hypothetical protein A2437_13115 [Bacteroidetes bacterium RIFOXYC2_FULL_40_12]|nr:MAG: hypothetical protein A2437_13115 [Bacteroidetes bacterium RIFOXYC2_FULL_40_12]
MNFETPNVPEKKEGEGKIVAKELNDAWGKLRTVIDQHPDYFATHPDIKDGIYSAVSKVMESEGKASIRAMSQEEKDRMSPEQKLALMNSTGESL